MRRIVFVDVPEASGAQSFLVGPARNEKFKCGRYVDLVHYFLVRGSRFDHESKIAKTESFEFSLGGVSVIVEIQVHPDFQVSQDAVADIADDGIRRGFFVQLLLNPVFVGHVAFDACGFFATGHFEPAHDEQVSRPQGTCSRNLDSAIVVGKSSLGKQENDANKNG